MSKARHIEGLDPAAPYRAMAARVIAVRAEEVFEHEQRVLDSGDIEPVHDMRVATRRLRAALEFFEPCFSRRPFKRVLRDVKSLADVLGERRDPDVQIAGLQRLRQEGPPAHRRALDGFIEALSERQRSGNEALARELERVHASDLPGRLARLSRSVA